MTEQEQSLETVLTDYIKKEPVSFEQKTDDIGFEMSVSEVKRSFSKEILTMGVGAAASGSIAGLIAGVLPLGSIQAVAGLPTIVAGVLGRVVLGNKMGTTGKDFFTGVLVAGISQTFSRFIPNFSQELSAKVQEEFKQEKPCQEQMRGDGIIW
jgi:hypothetical protein